MNRIRLTLGIRTKLLASFMLVAMFTGALGLNTVNTVDRLNASRDAQYNDVSGGTRLLVVWLNQARVSEGDLAEYMFETDPVARTQLRTEMALADEQLAQISAGFDGSSTDPGSAENSATLSQAWRASRRGGTNPFWRHSRRASGSKRVRRSKPTATSKVRRSTELSWRTAGRGTPAPAPSKSRRTPRATWRCRLPLA